MTLHSRSITKIAVLAGLLAAVPGAAFAHTGVGATHGFAAGFGHPVTGLDHVLAMVTAGLLAGQLGGRAIWAVPCTFVALMAVGGILGISGIDVPFVELGIALSVVVLGAAVAFGIKAPLALAMASVGLFAIFHGHAHGAEMPEDASGLAYGLGFVLATGLLHLAGIGLGLAIGALDGSKGRVLVRTAGAAVAVAGLGLVSGII